MKNSQQNERVDGLIMDEIEVKNLQEISGGSILGLINPKIFGPFPKPYPTGFIAPKPYITGLVAPTKDLLK